MLTQVLNLILSRGISGVAQALALVLLARWSSVEQFAVTAAATGAIVVVCAVCDLGMAGYISKARALGDHPAVRAALAINQVTAMAGYLLTAAVVLIVLDDSMRIPIAILALALFGEKYADTLLGVPIADGARTATTISVTGRRIVALALMFIANGLGIDGVMAYAAGYVGGALFAVVAGRMYIARHTASDGPHADRKIVLRQGVKYMIPYVAGQLRLMDVAIVGALAGPAVSAAYGAGARLGQPALLIPGAIGSVLLPYSATRDSVFARKAGVRLLWGTVGGIVVVLPAFLIPAWMITGLLGEEYASSVDVLAWSLLAIVLIGMSSAVAGVLQGRGEESYVVAVGVLSTVLLLASVAIGAVLGQSVGAAIGLFIGALIRWATHIVKLLWDRSEHGS
ncbi:lipopolysaccharide biosynthesis protein [Microbacterium gilvum]|uniref:Membrane protein involved in the export of O-antigen and teichoic acid n=1 Tax=Microbacterium gilvum TaxID=1336204 RepID=A0ABP9ACS2_9MICO